MVGKDGSDYDNFTKSHLRSRRKSLVECTHLGELCKGEVARADSQPQIGQVRACQPLSLRNLRKEPMRWEQANGGSLRTSRNEILFLLSERGVSLTEIGSVCGHQRPVSRLLG